INKTGTKIFRNISPFLLEHPQITQIVFLCNLWMDFVKPAWLPPPDIQLRLWLYRQSPDCEWYKALPGPSATPPPFPHQERLMLSVLARNITGSVRQPQQAR